MRTALPSPSLWRHSLAGLVGLALPGTALACGGAVVVPTDTPADESLYNRASHIALSFGTDDAGHDETTVTIAMDVAGDAAHFGVVFPVPVALGPDQVALGEPRDLEHIRQLTSIREEQLTCDELRDPVVYTCGRGGDGGDGSSGEEEGTGGDALVTVTDSWALGDFVVTALEADDGSALADWLRAEGLQVPSAMVPALEDYVEAGMAFVTLHSPEGLPAEQDALLPPVQLRLPGRLDRLPLQLGAATAQETMDVFLYLLQAHEAHVPDRDYVVGISNIDELSVQGGCMAREGGAAAGYAAEVEAAFAPSQGAGWVRAATVGEGVRNSGEVGSTWFQTDEDPDTQAALVALGAEPGTALISRLHLQIRPGGLADDPVLYRSATLLSTHLTYQAEFDATLSSIVPVCGEGVVAEGQCPPQRVVGGDCGDEDDDTGGQDRPSGKASACAVGGTASSALLALLPVLALARRRAR